MSPARETGPDWYQPLADFASYAVSADTGGLFPTGAALDFVPAGRQSAAYASRVNSFDWRNFFDRLGGGRFLRETASRLRSEYDYVLIDGRTGVSDTSGICTVTLPDRLVVSFTLNAQSIRGAVAVTESVQQQREALDVGELLVFPVPMRVELAEHDRLELARSQSRMLFDSLLSHVPTAKRAQYWGDVEILYLPIYAYEEVLAVFIERPDQQVSVLAALERLTVRVTGGDVTAAAAPPDPDRERVLAKYMAGPARLEVLRPGAPLGELHGVPALPAEFVARDGLAGLPDALHSATEGAVGVTGRGLGLHGQGGIGKTVLAAALAHDPEVRRRFPDGVFWITVGEGADLFGAQRDLLAQLGADTEFRTATEGRGLLTQALAERQCLLVVDDVWSAAAAAAFRVTGPRGRVLYTTRDPAVLRAVSADVMAVDVLSERAARQLLARLTQVDTLPAEADRVLEATGRVALALALVGAAIGAGGRTWQQTVQELDGGIETFLEHPHANTFKAMQVGVAALEDADAQAYRSLAVYPKDTPVPVAAVTRHWNHLWLHPPEETRAQLRTLA